MPTSGRQPTLTGVRVRLRPWRADDVDPVLAACQDAEIQRWTEVPVPYRREHAEAFVGEVADRTWAAGGGQFAVELLDGGALDGGALDGGALDGGALAGGALAGAMTLFPPRVGVGAGGYWTVAAHRGRGVTTEALRLLCGWAFDDLGLRRVELVVDPANAGSRGVAEGAGFRAEGVLRQRSLHRGVPVDDVIYGRLADDPRPTG